MDIISHNTGPFVLFHSLHLPFVHLTQGILSVLKWHQPLATLVVPVSPVGGGGCLEEEFDSPRASH